MHALYRTSRMAFAIWCIALALPSGADAQDGSDVPDSLVDGAAGHRLDLYLRRLAPFGYSGNALVAQHGQIVFANGYGVADRERHLPFTARTAVPAGSLVKPLTMLVILQLEQDGKLRTSDSLRRFFPDAPVDKRAITLDQLLNHTSGLPIIVGPGDRAPMERADFLRRVFAAPLLFPPGARDEYSNAGYSLLAAIIEQVTGTDFETAVQQRVLAPAGMTHTGWRATKWDGVAIAHIYGDDRDFGNMLDVAAAADGGINWNQRGNGGWLTTAEDLYRWHRALSSGALLGAAGQAKHEWTMGRDRLPDAAAGMAGGNGVFETAIEYRAAPDLFVFVHNNSGGPLAVAIAQTLARIALGDSVATPPNVVTLGAKALAGVIGTYVLPTGGRLTVDTLHGALAVGVEGQDAFDLLAGAPPATRVLRASASARTDSIVRAWRAGDWGPMHRAFGAAAPLEEFARRQSTMRARFDSSLGPVTGHTVLGTRRQGQALMTRVRIDHARGSVFENYGWAGSSIVLFGIQESPARDTFRPVSGNSFVDVDPRSGATVRLDARGDGTLVVHGAGGDVTARRRAPAGA